VLEPFERRFEGARLQAAVHHPSGFVALDEPRVLEDVEMLDEARQRHAEGLRQLADRMISLAQPGEHRAARRIGQRAEQGVKPAGGSGIVNHLV
jgi:hypothetical protein